MLEAESVYHRLRSIVGSEIDVVISHGRRDTICYGERRYLRCDGE